MAGENLSRLNRGKVAVFEAIMRDHSAAGARLGVIIAAVAITLFLGQASRSLTNIFSSSLPQPSVLIQLVMNDLEAEERATGEVDEYVRGQVSKAWMYLGRDDLAIEGALHGSDFWKTINLASVMQLRAELTGDSPSSAEFDALKLPDDTDWLVPLSIAEGLLESRRTAKARRTLESVPVNRGTVNAVIRMFHRLAQQLRRDGATNDVRDVLQQAARHIDDHLLFPDVELRLAFLTRLAVESHLTDLAERFRHQADVVNQKFHPGGKPISTPYSIFATLQAALACFELGDVTESRRQIELAIQQCEQIRSEELPSERDWRERSETLESLARRLNEFGLRDEAVKCLQLAGSCVPNLESPVGRDAGFRRLAKAAIELNHDEAATQFAERIESPSWKLIAARVQIEQLRLAARDDEARRRLLAAETLLPSLTELSSRIFEDAELGAEWERLGNTSRSREHFQRALALSALDEQSHHQSIARLQIEIGRLSDAFKTINLMSSRRYRIIPRVELAVAVARKVGEPRLSKMQ